MSASIYWKPVKPVSKKSLGTWAPQDFMKKMSQAFGETDGCRLNEQNLAVLQGMAIVWGDDDKDQKNPYRELIAAINKHGEIELEVEY